MKTLLSIAALMIALLAVSLLLGRRQVSNLRAQNQNLLTQVEQMNALREENAMLSSKLAKRNRANASTDPNLSELMKLRGEVGLLRQEIARHESATALSAKSAAPESSDTEASIELRRSKLRYAEQKLKEVESKFRVGAATLAELQRATLEHGILQAELQGASMRVRMLKVELAENNLTEAEAQANAGVISTEQLEQKKFERDLAAAEMNSNPVDIARIKLAAAESQLKASTAKRAAGVINEVELLRVQLERDIAAEEHQIALKSPTTRSR